MGVNRSAEYHLRKGGGQGKEEIRVLRGVVYMIKSRFFIFKRVTWALRRFLDF